MEKILKINKRVVKDQIGDLVRGTVEDTLNAMLDAEADNIVSHR